MGLVSINKMNYKLILKNRIITIKSIKNYTSTGPDRISESWSKYLRYR